MPIVTPLSVVLQHNSSTTTAPVARRHTTAETLTRFSGNSRTPSTGTSRLVRALGLLIASAIPVVGASVPTLLKPSVAIATPAPQEKKATNADKTVENLSPEQVQAREAESKKQAEYQRIAKHASTVERHLLRLGKATGDNIEELTRAVIGVLEENPNVKVDPQTMQYLKESSKRSTEAREALKKSGIVKDFPDFIDFTLKDKAQQEALDRYIQGIALDQGREIRNLVNPVAPYFRADSKREYWSDKFPLSEEARKLVKKSPAVEKILRSLDINSPALSLACTSLTVTLMDLDKAKKDCKTLVAGPFTGRLGRDYRAKPFQD